MPAFYNVDCVIKKHLRWEDETRGRTRLEESSWIIAQSQTALNKLATASKVTRLFLNLTHIFSLGWGLCGFHRKFMWDTRISRCPQMCFSCACFCRNSLALWSVPFSKAVIEYTPTGHLRSPGSVCENEPMSGESQGALGDADTRKWHFFHQRFSFAQRKPLCSSERISITRCRMGELNEAGCYRVYLGSLPCSQSVPEKSKCTLSMFSILPRSWKDAQKRKEA